MLESVTAQLRVGYPARVPAARRTNAAEMAIALHVADGG
jgi:hypothetical protein